MSVMKTHELSLSPYGGYFVTDNLCLDLNLRYTNRWHENGQSSEPGYGAGIGARYFVKRFYGGLGFDITSFRVYNSLGSLEGNYAWRTRKDAILKVGYMLPLLKHVYADLGVFYRIGLGDYTNSRDSSRNRENEEKEFGTTIGIAFFIK